MRTALECSFLALILFGAAALLLMQNIAEKEAAFQQAEQERHQQREQEHQRQVAAEANFQRLGQLDREAVLRAARDSLAPEHFQVFRCYLQAMEEVRAGWDTAGNCVWRMRPVNPRVSELLLKLFEAREARLKAIEPDLPNNFLPPRTAWRAMPPHCLMGLLALPIDESEAALRWQGLSDELRHKLDPTDAGFADILDPEVALPIWQLRFTRLFNQAVWRVCQEEHPESANRVATCAAGVENFLGAKGAAGRRDKVFFYTWLFWVDPAYIGEPSSEAVDLATRMVRIYSVPAASPSP